MSTNYRWYSVKKGGRSLRSAELVAKLRDLQGVDYWFEVESTSATSGFKFFRKSELAVARYGDGGLSYDRIETVTVMEAAIVSVKGQSLLRVANPGRNMLPLMTALEMAVGQGFTTKLLVADGAELTNLLSGTDVSKLVGLKIANAVVESGVVARMEFASKQGIDVSKIRILKRVEHKNEYQKYEFIYKGVRGHLACSSNGVMKIGGELAPRILKLVELDLVDQLTNK